MLSARQSTLSTRTENCVDRKNSQGLPTNVDSYRNEANHLTLGTFVGPSLVRLCRVPSFGFVGEAVSHSTGGVFAPLFYHVTFLPLLERCGEP